MKTEFDYENRRLLITPDNDMEAFVLCEFMSEDGLLNIKLVNGEENS